VRADAPVCAPGLASRLLLALAAAGYLLLRPEAPPPAGRTHRHRRRGRPVRRRNRRAGRPGHGRGAEHGHCPQPLVRSRTTDAARERPEPMLYVLRGSLPAHRRADPGQCPACRCGQRRRRLGRNL
jgi:hypothetical protein